MGGIQIKSGNYLLFNLTSRIKPAGLNILQLTNKVPYPPKDGGSLAVFNFSKAFSALGHRVFMLAMNTGKHPADVQQVRQDLHGILEIETVEIDNEIHLIPLIINLLTSQLPYNAGRFISEAYAKKLQEILQKTRFDFIQIEGIYLMYYVPVIRQFSTAKVILRAHNVEHEIWARTANSLKIGVKKAYLNLFQKRVKSLEISILNKYDALLPITEKDARQLNELGNKKPIQVAAFGFYFADFQKVKENQTEFSLFYIGALDWLPNSEGLLWFLKNCWQIIRKKIPNCTLHIAGRNATPDLERKFQLKGIKYHGEVPDSKIFMKEKSIMIVPLFSGSGMRVKIVEAMAMQKPVISTSLAAEGIDAEHNRAILLADTAKNFVQAVCKLHENQNLRRQIAKNAFSFARKKFDMLTIAQKTLEFYSKI